MSDWIDAQGYRANVGIVLMRDNGEVFLGQRTGKRGWQFPQGGVRQGEPVEQALYRELQEEDPAFEARARGVGLERSVRLAAWHEQLTAACGWRGLRSLGLTVSAS